MVKQIRDFLVKVTSILQQSTAALVYVNSCLNPLIYCWKLRHIRCTIKMTLRNVFIRRTVVQAAVEIGS